MGASTSQEHPSADTFLNDDEVRLTGAIVVLTKRLEAALERSFGAQGRGLHERITACEATLSKGGPRLVRALRKLATVRNRAVHEASYAVTQSMSLQQFKDDFAFCMQQIEALRSVGGFGCDAIDRPTELTPKNGLSALFKSDSEVFHLDLDDVQLAFVNGVLQQPRLAVIVGPPGTGKTHTLVAAIGAITNLKRGRVLACASNVLAANILAKLLLQTDVRTLRIFTKSTSPLDVRDSEFRPLLRFSNGVVDPVSNARVKPENFMFDSIFENATPELIASYDVVCIATAHTEFLQRTGVQFDFVIVDGAPQSVEAETLIPILSLPEATTLVLTGDVRQLGCSVAEENGFALLHKHAEDMRDDPRILCTVLKRCYRCHPAILDIFSSRFYNNTLVPAGENYVHLQCRYAPDPDHPIFFAHVPTTEVDTQEDCNVAEAAVVVSIVLRLLRDHGLSLSHGIGIVTPYRSQVLEIKKALWHAVLAQRLPEQHTHNILVGTVDQFQGQSRTVMLLSMVRPTRDEALTGSILTRGFVGNDPKSNVALSRAESLMCIVGDSEGLLQHSEADPWRTLITDLAQRGLVWAGASIQHDVDTEEVAPLRDDESDDAAGDDGSSD